jgi:hypothetical protein
MIVRAQAGIQYQPAGETNPDFPKALHALIITFLQLTPISRESCP